MSRHSVHFMGDSLPVAGAKRRYRIPSRFAQHVAPQLRMRPSSVEQLIFGYAPIHQRYATLLHAARALGDTEMEARLLAPVEIGDSIPIPFSDDLFLRVIEADSNEDLARELWAINRTPANLAAWRRAIAAERGSKLDILRSDLMQDGGTR